MKVILLEDVRKVGLKDEVVEVTQGYANNFLFKQNLAVDADKFSLGKLKKKQDIEEKQYQKDIQDAKEVKKDIEGKEFVFQLKAGKNGVAFGSISSKQILKRLIEDGYKVNKKMIIGDAINHIGFDKVTLQLHKEVAATMTIKVEQK